MFGENSLAVINKGTYGGSAEGGKLSISLLRTPVYSAHPIGNRQLADSDRSHDRIDIGEREFEYRLTADVKNIDMQAEIYNQPCIALSFFPSGAGEKENTEIEISNPDIIMTRYRQNENSFTVRLYNSSDESATSILALEGKEFEINFGKFEVKTFIFNNGKLTETDMI